MIEWISNKWAALTWEQFLIGSGVFILSLALNILIIFVVIVKLPADYFSSDYAHHFMPGKPWYVRWGAMILKNLLGISLLVVGIIMLIGPGQGILTILLALIMLDIPGKRPFETRIISRPTVRTAIDRIRAKYNKPPLILD